MTDATNSARPEGTFLGGLRRNLLSLVAMILLPLLMASGALWVSSGADGRLSRSEAAIVNLDEGATVGDRRMQLGQEYALALKGQPGANFTWRYGVSVSEAQEGLASGRYSAAVVIPSGFSRVLTGTSDAASDDRATLVVEQSPVSGVNDQVIFGQLSDAATRSLSSSVSRQYLDNIFVASTRVGEALGDAQAVAQEAYLASGRLQQQAGAAQDAAGDMDRQTTRSSRTASEVAADSDRAASSAASMEAVGSAAAAGPQDTAADQKATAALKDAAGKAKGVEESAAKAKASSDRAAKQAEAAGRQGRDTATSSAAMAKAAAANRDAARKYTGQVGDAVRQQAELQEQLVGIQKSLDSYVKNVQVVTTAVQKATTRTVSEQSATKPRPVVAPRGPEQAAATSSPSTLPRPVSSREAAAPHARPHSPQPAVQLVPPSGETAAASTARPQEQSTSSEAPAPVAPATRNPTSTVTSTVAGTATAEAPGTGVPASPRPTSPAGTQTRPANTPAPQAHDNATKSAAPLPAGGPMGAQAIIAAPVMPAAPAPAAPVPAAPVDPVAERDALVKELQAAAGQLEADARQLGDLDEQSARTSTAARRLKGAYSSLEKALPTQEISLNNGVGAGSTPEACRQFTDKQALRACKAGYEAGHNVAVAKVVAALEASTVDADIDGLVEQTTATAKQVAGLRTSTQQLAATLRTLADRLAAVDVTPDQGSTPAPTVTVTAPAPTVTVTVPAPEPTTPNPSTTEPSADPTTPDPTTPQPTDTATPIAPELETAEVTTALQQLNASSATVSEQLASLEETADKGRTALAEVGSGSDAAKDLTGGADAMNTAAVAQAAVVKQLQTSLSTLNENMAGLGSTMTGLQGQAGSLSDDTAAISDNATRLANRAAALDKTIAELSAAAGQAAADAQTAATRSAELQRQISGLQQASGLVSGTTTAVAKDAKEQATRTQTVARKVSGARKDLPTYDDQERQRLTDIVGKPIDTAQSQHFRNVGWVSMLMLLSLWAGAMALHSALAPVSRRARNSTARGSRLLVREMVPAAAAAVAQALAVSAAGQAALHMSAGRWAAVTATLVLASLAFAAINHSLVAFLRVFGRLIAAGCALVAGATVLTQAYPPAMDFLRVLSPLTPAVEAVRGVMTGAPGTATSFVWLLVWLVVGGVFSALAILRARNPEPVRVPTVHDV